MTQALYAHMNNKTIIKEKKELLLQVNPQLTPSHKALLKRALENPYWFSAPV
jgi:hypothetical protein